MPIQKLRPAFTFDQDRIEQLKTIAPEAFADGKINWDVLKDALGEHLEDESPSAEHFGLFWTGKREARSFATKPSTSTLIPVPGEGVDEDKTHNIFVEGDNLEVLKLLQKSYAGRVNRIYIDPPYNTGSDLIYRDDFTYSKNEYLRIRGELSEEGIPLTTNTRDDGRFHTNWLNMMYPRLRIAKSLLSNEGLIFVSIDDNEVHNLRQIMNEVFGEENFLAHMTWRGMHTVRNSSKDFNKNTEFVLCYCKDKGAAFTADKATWLREPMDKGDSYPHDDNDGKGPYKYDPLSARNFYTPYTHSFKNGVVWSAPSGQYPRYSQETLSIMEQAGEIYFGGGEPKAKRYLWRVQEGVPPDTLLPVEIVGFSKDGTSELAELFDGKAFDQPKPVSLIKHLLQLSRKVDRDDGNREIILDFFAGSGTTAHAIYEMNNEDKEKGNRTFILVQLQAPIEPDKESYKLGYRTISQVCTERIRRVCKKLKIESATGDLGFRVYKVAPSNFKQWQDYAGQDVTALEQQFAQFETPLVDDWAKENLLAEIILQQGFPLDSTITTQKEFTENDVISVSLPASAHKLYICLDEQIKDETASQLKLAKRDVFICLDSALKSEAKVRLGDAINLVVI